MKILLLTSIVLLTSCGKADSGNLGWKDSIQDIELNTLSSRILRLETDQSNADSKNQDAAFLEPSERNYSLIKSETGLFAVSLDNVAPYADGSRVSLKIGNLTGATVTKLKVNLIWGPTGANGLFSEKVPRKREHTFGGNMPSGAWVIRTVDLAGVPPAKLGMVVVRDAAVESISLDVSDL